LRGKLQAWSGISWLRSSVPQQALWACESATPDRLRRLGREAFLFARRQTLETTSDVIRDFRPIVAPATHCLGGPSSNQLRQRIFNFHLMHNNFEDALKIAPALQINR